MERASAARDAEIVVLNTCTVTDGADKDARASIRRLQRENPSCRILVTGCYAQRAPQELAVIPGVTWVVGNSHKHIAAQIAATSAPSTPGFVPLSQIAGAARIIVGDIFAHTQLLAAPVFDSAHERTRPNLKVQDGCDNRCSFCVIPHVRGQSRSLPLERVLAEIRTLVAAGYREVVISGINLGRWGRDLAMVGNDSGLRTANRERRNARPERATNNGQRLVDLVLAILDQTSLEKLRISSVEPMDWSDELIALLACSPRIAKHAHVPLQSASDAVLRRMHRKYRPWHYRERVCKIRAAMPNAAIGADVMVGFPGETDAEFAETQQMIEDLPFTYLHVFTYSPRPGTPAAQRRDQVPVTVARERNRVLREIAARKRAEFAKSQVGQTISAITLSSGDAKFTEALSDNYLKLKISSALCANRWLAVEVEAYDGEFLIGACEREGNPVPQIRSNPPQGTEVQQLH